MIENMDHPAPRGEKGHSLKRPARRAERHRWNTQLPRARTDRTRLVISGNDQLLLLGLLSTRLVLLLGRFFLRLPLVVKPALCEKEGDAVKKGP